MGCCKGGGAISYVLMGRGCSSPFPRAPNICIIFIHSSIQQFSIISLLPTFSLLNIPFLVLFASNKVTTTGKIPCTPINNESLQIIYHVFKILYKSNCHFLISIFRFNKNHTTFPILLKVRAFPPSLQQN